MLLCVWCSDRRHNSGTELDGELIKFATQIQIQIWILKLIPDLFLMPRTVHETDSFNGLEKRFCRKVCPKLRKGGLCTTNWIQFNSWGSYVPSQQKFPQNSAMMCCRHDTIRIAWQSSAHARKKEGSKHWYLKLMRTMCQWRFLTVCVARDIERLPENGLKTRANVPYGIRGVGWNLISVNLEKDNAWQAKSPSENHNVERIQLPKAAYFPSQPPPQMDGKGLRPFRKGQCDQDLRRIWPEKKNFLQPSFACLKTPFHLVLCSSIATPKVNRWSQSRGSWRCRPTDIMSFSIARHRHVDEGCSEGRGQEALDLEILGSLFCLGEFLSQKSIMMHIYLHQYGCAQKQICFAIREARKWKFDSLLNSLDELVVLDQLWSIAGAPSSWTLSQPATQLLVACSRPQDKLSWVSVSKCVWWEGHLDPGTPRCERFCSSIMSACVVLSCHTCHVGLQLQSGIPNGHTHIDTRKNAIWSDHAYRSCMFPSGKVFHPCAISAG